MCRTEGREGEAHPLQLKTKVELDKMVTNNHFRALGFDLSQTTNREAFILENPPFGPDQREWPRGLEMPLIPVHPLLGP